MGKKKSTKKTKKTTVNVSDVEARIAEVAKATDKTEQVVLEEMFGDGWLTVMIEESGSARIDASQLYAKKPDIKNRPSECERLRNTFAPIATCVKYVRDQLLGGGIEALIDNPKDKHQKDVKERITKLIDNIHQDRYTRGLFTLTSIMVDLALTTGVSAAEICFDKEKLDFWDYATISEEQKQMIEISREKKEKRGGTKTAEYILIETKEPSWGGLKGIVRFKIAHNARKRFKLYRDPKTWQAKYWSVDETVKKDNEAMTTQGIRISLRTFKQEKPNAVYMHPWQLFWLNLNRKNYSEMGESIIDEVLMSALLLEKILKAVGEGIYRAGNKKYFIICGTEKRQWSGPYIRNMLQQLKEASQKNWSTIPAPAGFDIKDIGGDVFEADKVVDYFKKIIARGMGVPAKVLGVEIRDEPHYGYEIMREQLRMAIKYQLFETHLWCEFGQKTRGKQGGKASKPVYVPNPRFKDESLLSFPERIELLFKGFNVANPFNPLIKLRAEREYCKLMGWDEILLPTQEELKAELDELERQAKEKMEKGKSEEEKPAGEKRQGKPEPQTKERQEKRLKGMTQKHPEKGKARSQGGTRIPKEVQESVVGPVVENKSEVKEVEVIRKVVTPTDEIMIELAGERIDLARKQKELTALQKKFAEEDNKRKQRKIQKDIDKINVEIEAKKVGIEKMKDETEKIKTETNEIVKTHEEKRKTMKEIQEQVKKEEEFMSGKETAGGEE